MQGCKDKNTWDTGVRHYHSFFGLGTLELTEMQVESMPWGWKWKGLGIRNGNAIPSVENHGYKGKGFESGLLKQEA